MKVATMNSRYLEVMYTSTMMSVVYYNIEILYSLNAFNIELIQTNTCLVHTHLCVPCNLAIASELGAVRPSWP
jgi:hypothetical protein